MLDLAQALPDLPRIELPRFGEGNTLLDAVEQLHAEKFLQRRNLAADGALRERQFLRGTRKTLVARGGFEGDEEFGSWKFSAHGIDSEWVSLVLFLHEVVNIHRLNSRQNPAKMRPNGI